MIEVIYFVKRWAKIQTVELCKFSQARVDQKDGVHTYAKDYYHVSVSLAGDATVIVP